MATIHTFYLSPEDWHPPFTLNGPEAHPLNLVLRMKAEASARLIDGEGKIGFFTVIRKEKHQIPLVRESETSTVKPAARHTLTAGFTQKHRCGGFLKKTVELEINSLWLWQDDHSQHPTPKTETKNTLFVVVPEGGFSLREVPAIQANFTPVSLGNRVLFHWETSASMALGLAWGVRQKL